MSKYAVRFSRLIIGALSLIWAGGVAAAGSVAKGETRGVQTVNDWLMGKSPNISREIRVVQMQSDEDQSVGSGYYLETRPPKEGFQASLTLAKDRHSAYEIWPEVGTTLLSSAALIACPGARNHQCLAISDFRNEEVGISYKAFDILYLSDSSLSESFEISCRQNVRNEPGRIDLSNCVQISASNCIAWESFLAQCRSRHAADAENRRCDPRDEECTHLEGDFLAAADLIFSVSQRPILKAAAMAVTRGPSKLRLEPSLRVKGPIGTIRGPSGISGLLLRCEKFSQLLAASKKR